MVINYELLKTFVVAGTAPTFSAAAALRHVSVSAISQQIKTLETQLGAPLFERIGRRARLTPAGSTLLEALQIEMARIDDALLLASSDYTAVRGEVSLGSPRTFGRYWLRPRLPALFTAHPALRVRVEFGVWSTLERGLAEGRLDIIIVGRVAMQPGIETVPLATEHFVAVASPAYLARWGTPTTLAEFSAHRYVVFDADLAMHADFWRASFGARAPLPEAVICEIASLEEMMALALAGTAIAILPDYQVDEAVRAGELTRLAPVSAGRARPARNTLFLAWRRGAIESARLQVVRAALQAAAPAVATPRSPPPAAAPQRPPASARTGAAR